MVAVCFPPFFRVVPVVPDVPVSTTFCRFGLVAVVGDGAVEVCSDSVGSVVGRAAALRFRGARESVVVVEGAGVGGAAAA